MTYKTTYWDSESQSQKERDCTPEEIAEIDARKAAAIVSSANSAILNQILAIEATVTQRRLREAVTTIEGEAWLNAVDSQIAGLRAQLT